MDLTALFMPLFGGASMGQVALGPDGSVQALNGAARRRLGLPEGQAGPTWWAAFLQGLKELPPNRETTLVLTGAPDPPCRMRLTPCAAQEGPWWLGTVLEGLGEGRPGLDPPEASTPNVVRVEAPDPREAALARERAAHQAKGRMAAYLAHEVNNPLGGVKNAALLIRRFPDDPAKQVRYLDLLDQGVARIQEVIRSLVDLYQPVQPTDTLDVRECVQELQRLMARTLEARGLTLETTLTHGVRLPSQEGEILRQVAFNLLRNAAEASPPGGKVSLVLSLAEQRLVLEVMDEGPGIPDERQADLWNSGYSTKRATVAGGLTLGLALSRRLLRDLGGDLVLAPHSPGRGAHFSILLPLAPMKAADPSSSSAVP